MDNGGRIILESGVLWLCIFGSIIVAVLWVISLIQDYDDKEYEGYDGKDAMQKQVLYTFIVSFCWAAFYALKHIS